MRSKVVLSMLIACTSPLLVHAAEPANSTLLKQCESAKGEVKAECEEVATQMMKHPDQQKQRTDKTSQDVTHSSPVMENDKPATPSSAKPTPPKQDAKKDKVEPKLEPKQ